MVFIFFFRVHHCLIGFIQLWSSEPFLFCELLHLVQKFSFKQWLLFFTGAMGMHQPQVQSKKEELQELRHCHP